jgi:hypothetical protein
MMTCWTEKGLIGSFEAVLLLRDSHILVYAQDSDEKPL